MITHYGRLIPSNATGHRYFDCTIFLSFISKLEGRARTMQLHTRVVTEVFGSKSGVNVVRKRFRVVAMLLRLNL